MYDQELDTNCPYDNVEFPVRKPGTGTWPGPGGTAGGTGGAGTGVKHYGHGHQTTGRIGGGAPKLAPLVEVEGSEGGETNRMQAMSFGNTTSPSVSSSSSSSQQQQQQSQSQNKFSTQSTTSQNTAMTSQTQSSVAATTTSSLLPSSGTSLTTTASTAATIATTTTTSASTTNNSGKQTADKNSRPIITVTNDSNTYIAAQVAPSNDPPRKKTLKQVETEEEDFKRQDLNPGSRVALERVYTQHPDFYQLNTKVLDEGSLLKQDVLDIYRRTGESLTYEQLLQGILVDGERFLLGSCWLYYTHVQFLDLEGTKTLREPYGRGRIGLTSKRALFLSTETYTDANLEQFDQKEEDPKKKNKPDTKGYKLEVSKRSAITFKNIPLSNFHSAEMEIITGTAAQTKITKKPGCCTCFGLLTGRWESTPPMTRSINRRVLRVGVSMPPWQTRMFLDIHLDPSMSLTVARDFISQLHAFAPHMH